MIIVIPAYNPDYHLQDLIKESKSKLNKYKIIVVDDGSNKESNKIFDSINEYVTILKHKVNMGKGAAMKTAVKYIKNNFKDTDGIIFVDADGQHKVEDVKKVIDKFNSNKDSLIIGARLFTNKVPFKSRMGNIITRGIFRLSTKVIVTDTQSGLRAISIKYANILTNTIGNRYEYEMNMLLNIAKKGINIIEVPIETIYEDKKNSTSHFKAVRDSYLIYKGFFKFMLSSISLFLIDCVLFLIFYKFVSKLFVANVLARLISGSINYLINKYIVFEDNSKLYKSIFEYMILATFIVLINSAILYLLNIVLGNIVLAKILAEIILFTFSFIIQEKYIFSKKLTV